MQKTKIDWADMTFNPVTGCKHGCEYCYASRIARRFGGYSPLYTEYDVPSYELTVPCFNSKKQIAPFPFKFEPTFHKYRLNEPQRTKKPQNIFVCSMADLFGEWVHDEWIQEVFRACEKAPQHRYLFLTKNPKRYMEYEKKYGLPVNHWYGTTITKPVEEYLHSNTHKTFLSIEPIQEEFSDSYSGDIAYVKWVIIGAETGNRKNKVLPKRHWIDNIVNVCSDENIPVFLKNSLASIWGEPLIQEYPW
jgi:protein gp37